MSSFIEGINNAVSLTAQINSLRSMKDSDIKDPEALKLALEKNFNQMLNDLVSTTNEKDEENDPTILNSLPDTSSPEYLKSLYYLGQF